MDCKQVWLVKTRKETFITRLYVRNFIPNEKRYWIFPVSFLLVVIFIIATIFFSACLFLYVAIIFRAISLTSIFSDLKSIWKKFWLPIIFISITCLGIIYWLVLKNQFVYYWDYGGYWTRSYELVENFYSEPIRTFREFVYSLRHDDYNPLLSSIVSLPLKNSASSFQRM